MHLGVLASAEQVLTRIAEHTGMADTGVVYLNADFVRSWWSDLDVLNSQVLAGFPCDRGLLQSAQCLESSFQTLDFGIRVCVAHIICVRPQEPGRSSTNRHSSRD
jgi:hypothetical protein